MGDSAGSGERDDPLADDAPEGRRTMVRGQVNLAAARRVRPVPSMGEGRRAVAWVEIGGAGELAVYGSPTEMRALAAAATNAADAAEGIRRAADRRAAVPARQTVG